jgi:hypothetical protein
VKRKVTVPLGSSAMRGSKLKTFTVGDI